MTTPMSEPNPPKPDAAAGAMSEGGPPVVVRFEIEYSDGTIERATGLTAAAVWCGLANVLSLAQVHGVRYRGPKLERVERKGGAS